MRALYEETLGAAWASAGALIPDERVSHPLGGCRPRVGDRTCFNAIVVRLVTGCSWDTAAVLSPKPVSATTLRRRYKAWNAAGVFDWIAEEAIESYDRIVGLDYSAAAVDGSVHQAPCGGPGTGKSPVDRAKSGWKLSLLSDAAGIPLGWAADTAGRHDSKLLAPTLVSASRLGVIPHFETLLADRGYTGRPARECAESFGVTDFDCARRSAKGRIKHTPLGGRWVIERANSWMSNFGQIRRSTDRDPKMRLGQIALAVALILIVKLIDWRNRYQPT